MESKRPDNTEELPLDLQYKILEFLGMSTFESCIVAQLENKTERKTESKDVKKTLEQPVDFNRFAGWALRATYARRLNFLNDMHTFRQPKHQRKNLFPEKEFTQIQPSSYLSWLEEIDPGKWFLDLIDSLKKPNLTLAKLIKAAKLDVPVIKERLAMQAAPNLSDRIIDRQLAFIIQLCARNQLELIESIYSANPDYPLVRDNVEKLHLTKKLLDELTPKIVAEKKWSLFVLFTRRADYRKAFCHVALDSQHSILLPAILASDNEEVISIVIECFGHYVPSIGNWYTDAFATLLRIRDNNEEAEKQDIVDLNLKRVMFGLSKGLPDYVHADTYNAYFTYAYDTNNLELFGKLLSHYLKNRPHLIDRFFHEMRRFCELTEPRAKPFQKIVFALPQLFEPTCFKLFRPLLARRIAELPDAKCDPVKYTSDEIVFSIESMLFPQEDEKQCWPEEGNYDISCRKITEEIFNMDEKAFYGQQSVIDPVDLTGLLATMAGVSCHDSFKAIVTHRKKLYANATPVKLNPESRYHQKRDALFKKYQVKTADELSGKLREAALAGDAEAVAFVYSHAAGDAKREANFSEQLQMMDVSRQNLIELVAMAEPTPGNSQVFNLLWSLCFVTGYQFDHMSAGLFLKPDFQGVAPLHLVLQFGNLAKAKNILMQAGLHAELVTSDKRNTLDCIAANQNNEIYTFIKKVISYKNISSFLNAMHVHSSSLYTDLRQEFLGSSFALEYGYQLGLKESEVATVCDFYFKRRKPLSKSQFDAVCLVFLLDQRLGDFLCRVDLLKAYRFFVQTQLGEALEFKQAAPDSIPLQVFKHIADVASRYWLNESVLETYICAKFRLVSKNEDDLVSGVQMLLTLFEDKRDELNPHFMLSALNELESRKAQLHASFVKRIDSFRESIVLPRQLVQPVHSGSRSGSRYKFGRR